MGHLKYSDNRLKAAGGFQTAKEISQQPEVWEKTADKFSKESNLIYSFINQALKETEEIVFTGAGSSSFIGYSLSGIIFKYFEKSCRTIPTTDIVTFPEYYFNAHNSYLIISFARSGESPESIAALELADRYCRKCFHLIITCDSSGSLAHYHSKNPVSVFNLPNEANDKGLAMTGSYTSMLLSGLLMILFHENSSKYREKIYEELELSIRLAEHTLHNNTEILKSIADKDFKRAVFLGSGSLYGTAMEGALKLQELTNGNIICKSDTFLGFRHGPKVIINEDTLVVYFFSNNDYVHQYEMDLVNSMNKGTPALFHLGIGGQYLKADQLDLQIDIFEPDKSLNENFQALNYIIPVQLLSLFKSIQLGMKPDAPSSNGAISRVVKGVNIYPFNN